MAAIRLIGRLWLLVAVLCLIADESLARRGGGGRSSGARFTSRGSGRGGWGSSPGSFSQRLIVLIVLCIFGVLIAIAIVSGVIKIYCPQCFRCFKCFKCSSFKCSKKRKAATTEASASLFEDGKEDHRVREIQL